MDGGDLVLKAFQPLPDDLLAELKAHKPDLIALLSARADREAQELTPDLSRVIAMTKEVFSRPPKPQPDDGLSPDAWEALGVIRKIANSKGILDTLAVADAMQVSVTALSGALVELEGQRLIQPGDWTRCGTQDQAGDPLRGETTNDRP